jgi:hypothetical protein
VVIALSSFEVNDAGNHFLIIFAMLEGW